MTIERPILIAGFGSVGQRHLRNLRALGQENFVFYRTGNSTLPDDEIADFPVEYDLDKALAYNPIATLITNPTSLHMNVALAAAEAGSHLFLEKPISHNLDGVEELTSLVSDKKLIVQVGYQFRFHPLLQETKKLLDQGIIGNVAGVAAGWSEYLPNWHPWEDYHRSYAARAELGGGVLLTLSHPFDYLRWLFGEVESVISAGVNSESILGINVEEEGDILFQFKSGMIGSVHLDYLSGPNYHNFVITGREGTIDCYPLSGLNVYQANGELKDKIVVEFNRNTMFQDEMRHFIDCISKNEQPLCTLSDGIEALRIALAAKQSAREGRLIKLI